VRSPPSAISQGSDMTPEPHFDDVARYNRDKWNALARAGVQYSLPMLDMDAATARRRVDSHRVMEKHARDLDGADVLCLAAGGGQQSAAFALLGANVSVLDLSDTQLERDSQAAEHYGLEIDTVHGDMRDLSAFADDAFDVVYQAFSLNFVPRVEPVHAEVARVLRPHGLYRLEWSNPFTQTVDEESWNGEGYLLRLPYVDGREMSEIFPQWDITGPDGAARKLASPREYVHTLSAMINGLASYGFVILHVSEDTGQEPDPEPGSWQHFMQVSALFLTIWSKLLPAATAPGR
jgi:SAM-dependent methyltransferase